MQCFVCKMVNLDNANFCSNCGNLLNNITHDNVDIEYDIEEYDIEEYEIEQQQLKRKKLY